MLSSKSNSLGYILTNSSKNPKTNFWCILTLLLGSLTLVVDCEIHLCDFVIFVIFPQTLSIWFHFFQWWSGLISCIIWWRSFILRKITTEIGKRIIFSNSNDFEEKKCIIKNMNLINTYYRWKNLVDWISNMATSKMHILRKTQKLKLITLHNFTFYITISYWTATFHNFALTVETVWVTRMVIPIWKARNDNDGAC